MSAPSTPTIDYGPPGNLLSSAPLAAGAGSGGTLDLTAGGGGWLSVVAAGGSAVAATSGCRVRLYPWADATGDWDAVPLVDQTIALAPSTVAAWSTVLPPAKYLLSLGNLDLANGITISAGINRIT